MQPEVVEVRSTILNIKFTLSIQFDFQPSTTTVRVPQTHFDCPPVYEVVYVPEVQEREREFKRSHLENIKMASFLQQRKNLLLTEDQKSELIENFKTVSLFTF